MKAVRVQQWKPEQRRVIFQSILSSAELQMVENVCVRNQSGQHHKTKKKNNKITERCSVPAQQMKLHVFFLSAVFVSPQQPLSFSNTWLIADSLWENILEKSSNYSVGVWKSPFECRPPASCVVSPADTSQSSGWFLTWSTVLTQTPPGHVPVFYLLRGCLKWLSSNPQFLSSVFWRAEYKDILWSFFFTVLPESRGSNMKENAEVLCWYLIVRVGEAASGVFAP